MSSPFHDSTASSAEVSGSSPRSREDLPWLRFLHRYQAFIRGYLAALGVGESEREEVLRRVVVGFLSVRPHFDRERAREGRSAVEYVAWAARVTLAQIRIERGPIGHEGKRESEDLGTHRPDPPPASETHATPASLECTRCHEIWDRIALHRALREVRAAVGARGFLAYALTAREKWSDDAAASHLGCSRSEVKAMRREVRDALIREVERYRANRDAGEPAARRPTGAPTGS